MRPVRLAGLKKAALLLTGRCNLRCTYCYLKDGGARSMSRPTALGALEVLSRGGGPREIVFFGGEPLLEFPLLRELVAYARTLETAGRGPFHFGFPTNGTLLTGAIIDFCRTERVALTLSMDGGRRASAGRLTGRGGESFRKVRLALAALRNAELPFDVKMTVTPDNAGEFADSLDFLIDEGARTLDWSLALNLPWTKKALLLYAGQLARAAERYVRRRRSGEPLELVELEADMAALRDGGAAGHGRCDAGLSYLAVGTGGELYPCHAFFSSSRHQMGTLSRGVSADARRFFGRLTADRMKGCEPCGLRRHCRRCLAVNAAEGDVCRVPGRSCLASKIGLDVAGRALSALAEGSGAGREGTREPGGAGR